MAITDDLRKTFSDPTPLYFAAGTADLAFQQAKKVPVLVEQLRTEAPARIEAVRNTDPKAVQEKATARVKETQGTLQTKVNEFLGFLDADLKKLGETAQDLALRGVGVAAEYAVKARETYEKVAEHGEQAVRTWRGQAAEGIEDIAEGVEEVAVAVEPKPEPVTVADDKPAAAKKAPAARKAPAAKKSTATPATATPATPATVAKKTTPPAK
ncbi:hypothetical protein [Streptomyces sp. JHA26]|uniref:hypothetical protein n=1 Tax=Streptomyces sp. JHA26 TaxID=1917143 RepID=UPI00098B6848|nr:hypothetical protein [Streptomyces sp. JHA26]